MISADENSTITSKDRIRKIEELKLNVSLLGHAQWEVTQRFSQKPGFGHPNMMSRILRSTLPKSKLDRTTSFAAILEIVIAIAYCHSFIRPKALAHFSGQIAPPRDPFSPETLPIMDDLSSRDVNLSISEPPYVLC